MSIKDFESWLHEHCTVDCKVYVKRLSGNDTLANGSHQAGTYMPKAIFLEIFSEWIDHQKDNPDIYFRGVESPSAREFRLRAVWYNNKLRGQTRDETRLTGFGGKKSVMLDPENTGAIAILAFKAKDYELNGHFWVCEGPEEEDLFQERYTDVEHGSWLYWSPTKFLHSGQGKNRSCRLTKAEIRPEWFDKFPSGKELVELAVQRRPGAELKIDQRLLARRDCEFEAFRSIEEAVEMPVVERGFNDLSSFLAKAQSILQRRKVRAGNSLEYHLHAIFGEEGLVAGQDFDHGVESEKGRRPDFLFPSKSKYDDPSFPDENLRMLAVKTTCKDRWRQILNESKRIKKKHLFTLQRGISTNQFLEMKQSGVVLVTPSIIHKEFNSDIRGDLKSLEDFVDEIRVLT